MKVLVVDDSALMRRWLKQCMEEIGAEVMVARSGADALKRLPEFQPNVVTLDINMPEMDGLTCLAHIMSDYPCPVVMLSSLTSKGAMATLEALELGAVDYFEKPGGTVSHGLKEQFEVIQSKVKAAATARLRKSEPQTPRPPGPARPKRARLKDIKLVMFGVSTGGPGTVERILQDIDPEISAPILVAQHMPNRFVDAYAERLSGRLNIEIQALTRSQKMLPGTVVVAGADTDVVVSVRDGHPVARQAPQDNSRIWHPSIDRMVETALNAFPAKSLLAVQLTGMGNDGATAMAELKNRGGYTIAESEETAVIFGMPRELIELDGANQILPHTKIGAELNTLVGTRTKNLQF